jgi:HWE histidine kinase
MPADEMARWFGGRPPQQFRNSGRHTSSSRWWRLASPKSGGTPTQYRSRPRPWPYQGELQKRYIRKDGNAVWARATVNVIRDGSGRALRNTAVILDITERKEREEKEQLLMREINHRAKNMLSVVHSIARQTATQSPEDFVESFSECGFRSKPPTIPE